MVTFSQWGKNQMGFLIEGPEASYLRSWYSIVVCGDIFFENSGHDLV